MGWLSFWPPLRWQLPLARATPQRASAFLSPTLHPTVPKVTSSRLEAVEVLHSSFLLGRTRPREVAGGLCPLGSEAPDADKESAEPPGLAFSPSVSSFLFSHRG